MVLVLKALEPARERARAGETKSVQRLHALACVAGGFKGLWVYGEGIEIMASTMRKTHVIYIIYASLIALAIISLGAIEPPTP